jgi:PKD repeat protein
LSSAQANDNVQSQQLQGHVGSLVECLACHPTVPSTVNGGPHLMHPVGQTWISGHRREGRGSAQCQACHNSDYRGTVLGLMQSDQNFSGGGDGGGIQPFWRGFQIGCYNCHNGPSGGGEGRRANVAAAAVNKSAATIGTYPVTMALQASDTDGDTLTYRIVSQPAHGIASLNGNVATYFPSAGFFGSDVLTYSAWDGFTDSNLGSVALTVNQGDCALTATGTAPTAAFPNASTPFRGVASLAQCASTGFVYDWDFGDGTPHASDANPCHAYTAAGDYHWKLTVTANGLSQTVNGVVTVSPTLGSPLPLSISVADSMILLSWPLDRIPVSLESSQDLGQPYSWQPVPDAPVVGTTNVSLQVYILPGPQLFRLRRVP